MSFSSLRFESLALGLALIAMAASGRKAHANDWPQWRGPDRTGLSRETGLLKEWPEAGPRMVWMVKTAGSGYSTPSVVGERLYLLGNEGLENEFVQAMSAKDGATLWRTRLGNVGNPKQQPSYPAARSTPTIVGETLFAFSSDGDLVCLNIADGKERWRTNVRTALAGMPGTWAYSESPLVHGDAVVVTPGGPQATMAAFNRKNGEVIWKSPIPEGDPAAYTSAQVAKIGGVEQYVQFLQKGLVGVSTADGKFLWRYDHTAKGSPANIPMPVVDGAEIFTATSRGGCGLIRVGSGPSFTTEEIYFGQKYPKTIGSAVKLGQHLYGTSAQGLMCIEFATGKIAWEESSLGAASVCYADGRLYLHQEKGGAALVEPTPEAFRQKGHFEPTDQPERGNSQAWAYPVVANGRLYLRDLGRVWCYDVKAP